MRGSWRSAGTGWSTRDVPTLVTSQYPWLNRQLPWTRAMAPDTAELVVEQADTRRALALIATLPPDQAEAILLRVVAGLEVAQVADIMGRSPGAVRVLTHRGLKTLAARVVSV